MPLVFKTLQYFQAKLETLTFRNQNQNEEMLTEYWRKFHSLFAAKFVKLKVISLKMTLMLITFTKIWLCVFGIAWILLCLPIKWLYFFRSQIRSWHHHLKSPRQIAFSANVVKFHNSRRPHIPLMERGSKNDKDVFFQLPKKYFPLICITGCPNKFGMSL